MAGSTILQIFLFLQVFLIGALSVVAWRHARAHFSHAPHESEQHPTDVAPAVELPQAVKERLLNASQEQFEAAVKNSAAQLKDNLEYTNQQINDLVMRLATEVVSSELERYKEELAALQGQAKADMGSIRTEITKHEDELKAKMAQEIDAEKQRLIKQIDTKLADAVGSFLSETLQHNIDLGSQSAYLVAMLEEHKADFIKEVGNETENQPTG
jgi:uncharacterized protein YaaR (DUF327 family)